MSDVSLILCDTSFAVGLRPLIANCDLFADGDPVTTSPYRIKSKVPLKVFQQFVKAIEGEAVEVTSQNFSCLTQLCDEFGFQTLSSKIADFRNSPEFKDSADDEARLQISGLEEQISQQEWRIMGLEADISRLAQPEADVSQTRLNLAQVISNAETIPPQIHASSQAPQTQIPAQPSPPQLSPPQTRAEPAKRPPAPPKAPVSQPRVQKQPSSGPPTQLAPPQLSPPQTRAELAKQPSAPSKVPVSPQAPQAAIAPQQTRPQVPPAAPKLDSRVVSYFPRLFDEFRRKWSVLLWRGSREGFGAGDFHGRCNGHANTLKLILDTGGNVFGGFTPMQWESGKSPNATTA
jgi:hypothetical protein